MSTPLTITFRLIQSRTLCGAMDIHMKAPLTEEVYRELCLLLESRFHYILTHRGQEGVEEHSFCAAAFQSLFRTVEEVGAFFGENAIVMLDRNMAFYHADGMENLFGQELELTVGVPRRGEGEGEGEGEEWEFVPLAEGWEQLLA